jgi:hypothetical protein
VVATLAQQRINRRVRYPNIRQASVARTEPKALSSSPGAIAAWKACGGDLEIKRIHFFLAQAKSSTTRYAIAMPNFSGFPETVDPYQQGLVTQNRHERLTRGVRKTPSR